MGGAVDGVVAPTDARSRGHAVRARCIRRGIGRQHDLRRGLAIEGAGGSGLISCLRSARGGVQQQLVLITTRRHAVNCCFLVPGDRGRGKHRQREPSRIARSAHLEGGGHAGWRGGPMKHVVGIAIDGVSPGQDGRRGREVFRCCVDHRDGLRLRQREHPRRMRQARWFACDHRQAEHQFVLVHARCCEVDRDHVQRLRRRVGSNQYLGPDRVAHRTKFEGGLCAR